MEAEEGSPYPQEVHSGVDGLQEDLEASRAEEDVGTNEQGGLEDSKYVDKEMVEDKDKETVIDKEGTVEVEAKSQAALNAEVWRLTALLKAKSKQLELAMSREHALSVKYKMKTREQNRAIAEAHEALCQAQNRSYQLEKQLVMEKSSLLSNQLAEQQRRLFSVTKEVNNMTSRRVPDPQSLSQLFCGRCASLITSRRPEEESLDEKDVRLPRAGNSREQILCNLLAITRQQLEISMDTELLHRRRTDEVQRQLEHLHTAVLHDKELVERVQGGALSSKKFSLCLTQVELAKQTMLKMKAAVEEILLSSINGATLLEEACKVLSASLIKAEETCVASLNRIRSFIASCAAALGRAPGVLGIKRHEAEALVPTEVAIGLHDTSIILQDYDAKLTELLQHLLHTIHEGSKMHEISEVTDNDYRNATKELIMKYEMRITGLKKQVEKERMALLQARINERKTRRLERKREREGGGITKQYAAGASQTDDSRAVSCSNASTQTTVMIDAAVQADLAEDPRKKVVYSRVPRKCAAVQTWHFTATADVQCDPIDTADKDCGLHTTSTAAQTTMISQGHTDGSTTTTTSFCLLPYSDNRASQAYTYLKFVCVDDESEEATDYEDVPLAIRQVRQSLQEKLGEIDHLREKLKQLASLLPVNERTSPSVAEGSWTTVFSLSDSSPFPAATFPPVGAASSNHFPPFSPCLPHPPLATSDPPRPTQPYKKRKGRDTVEFPMIAQPRNQPFRALMSS